jgi:hypothetical protein
LPVSRFFQRPGVGILAVSKNISISIVRLNTKVNTIACLPLIFNRLDEEGFVADPEFDRTLINFVTRVTLDLDFHNWNGVREIGKLADLST